MTKQIVIVDYGMGNLHSVNKAMAAVGAEPLITSDPQIIAKAEKLILPGVGAFGDCMANLHKWGLISVLQEYLASGRPFLGICLGMQVLFEGSEEAPGVEGLGYFKGQVKRIVTDYKVPHMGWNQLELAEPSPLLYNAGGEYVYFVHSFHCVPDDKNIITSVCNYGTDITASVGKDNVQAVQFHPEKSSTAGLQMLKNFGEWKL